MNLNHKQKLFFPWRLYRTFLIQQLFWGGALVTVALLVIVLYYRQRLLREALSYSALEIFDETVLFTLLSVGLSFTIVGIWNIHLFLAPLRRALLRAHSLIDKNIESHLSREEDVTQNEIGEWTDLELVLERVRKEIEQKSELLSKEHAEFEALLHAVPEPVFAVNREKYLQFFNPQFALLFDLHHRRSNALQLADAVRSPDLLKSIDSVLENGRSLTCPISIKTESEKQNRQYVLSVAPVRRIENEKIPAVVGILFDVTELKRAEQVRIEFVGNVSHELRTPLTAIHGYTDVLKHDLPNQNPHVSKYLDIILKNVSRLRELVDDLLDLSSLESGVGIRSERVLVREITERAIQQIESRSTKKDQIVVATFGVEHVQGDPNRIEQVLINLLDNAIKYTPVGGRIEIVWEGSASYGVLMRVCDNGPGIPEEHQERLFERFYRIEESRTRDHGSGSGLGLAIAKHIMQRHGGTIALKSSKGHGTEFICHFPR